MSKQKQQYRIRNWQAYNAALVERGSLTVWFEDSHRARWYETARSGRRGAPRRYSDIAVQCGLVIREVFHLPLRATEGLMQSLVTLLGSGLGGSRLQHVQPPGGDLDRPDQTVWEQATP